ncbi:primosomal protein N' family DNA-binding protein [Nesterenkonia suensis]
MTEHQDRQPALLDALAPPRPARLPAGATETLPVARVLLDSGVPHLDRPFDYVVPRDHDHAVVAGGRVKVRFSGRELLGFVVERCAAPETASRLSMIHKVVSAVSVLSPEIMSLAEKVAERGAGVTSDVLRAAIPPRVARVEKEFEGLVPPSPELTPGEPGPRRAGLALTSYGEQSWAAQIVDVVCDCLEDGGDAVVVLPDARDVDHVAQALDDALGTEQVARLTADVGPTPRYRAFLRLRFGQARVAVGTRSAVFAPVPRLRQLIVVDDDDPSHAEPRAPYHHVREVALLRTVQSGSSLLFLSTSRSLEVQRLVERGWLEDQAPDRAARRDASPLMVATADSHHSERDPMSRQVRLPAAAYRTAQQALTHGPILVQVARAGFVPAVLCQRCRARQHCPSCHGPLSLPPHHEQSGTLRCRWCGLHHRAHRCAECGHDRFRAGVRGADRTAHELGRAFPNTTVISSTADHPVREVSAAPAVVVSTPGVEPVAEHGYAAALLLDGDAQLSREGLDVPRRVLARWFRAASLVRPHRTDPARSGSVVVTAEAEELTAALVRWDPVAYARRELYRRLELGLPPAKRMLSLTAEAGDAEEFIRSADLPDGVDWIGPSPLEDGRHRYLLFFGYAQAQAIIAEMSRLRRTQSAQHSARAVRIVVDDVAVLQI